MKTVWEFTDYLDSQAAMRRRELTTLSLAVRKQADPNKAFLSRWAVACAYAHFEGFVVDSGRKYIEHIALQGQAFVRLKNELKVNALHVKLRSLEKTDRVWMYLEVVEILQGAKPANVDASVIDAQDNLKFEVFKDILVCCGFDPRPYQTMSLYIDNELLAVRNRIAHGSLEPVSEDDAVMACNFARGVIDVLHIAFSNGASSKTYLI